MLRMLSIDHSLCITCISNGSIVLDVLCQNYEDKSKKIWWEKTCSDKWGTTTKESQWTLGTLDPWKCGTVAEEHIQENFVAQFWVKSLCFVTGLPEMVWMFWWNRLAQTTEHDRASQPGNLKLIFPSKRCHTNPSLFISAFALADKRCVLISNT